MKKSFLVLFVLFAYLIPAEASTRQSQDEIRRIALEFAQQQTRTLPGQVEIKIDKIDPRLTLAACNKVEAYMPNGATLLGKTSIGVRCNEAKGWSLFVSAHIKVTVEMLLAKRPLQQGQILTAADLATRAGELSQNSFMTDPVAAIGKVLKYSIAAGQPLRIEMLRAPFLVTQGQTVTIQVLGKGYEVHTEGQALSSAAEGHTAQLRTTSGKVVSGIVQPDGTVQIQP
jgi:flagella basal body P-ring formation protein FlgA